MRSAIAFLLTLAVLCAFQTATALVDKKAALNAFEYLNKVRRKPADYCQTLHFSPYQVQPRAALIWNDTLALIAERKAMDMATRNYFAHVDPYGYGMNHHIDEGGYKLEAKWLKDARDNNFEALQGGADTGVDAIKDLILDRDTPSRGHRLHLLGVGSWNASLVDIGIGFVRSYKPTRYDTYVCVLIAKHE